MIQKLKGRDLISTTTIARKVNEIIDEMNKDASESKD